MKYFKTWKAVKVSEGLWGEQSRWELLELNWDKDSQTVQEIWQVQNVKNTGQKTRKQKEEKQAVKKDMATTKVSKKRTKK